MPKLANLPSFNSTRTASDIVFDATGNFTVIGLVNQPFSISVSNSQTYVTKFNGSTGNIIFQKIFGNASNLSYGGPESFSTIALDSSNNYILTTNSPSFGIVANINPTFTAINWQKNISFSSNVIEIQDSVHSNNNTYIVGYTGPNTNTIISKLDSNGNILWAKTSSVLNATKLSISIDETNNTEILVTSAKSINASASATVLLNIDVTDGNINWQRELSYIGTNSYVNTSLAVNSVDINNNIAITGFISEPDQRGTIIVLPKNGGIPSDGNYSITSELILNYTISNIALSNISLSVANSNGNILNPANSTFFSNVAVTANSNILATTTFSQLT
jgi:hypothetical protein